MVSNTTVLLVSIHRLRVLLSVTRALQAGIVMNQAVLLSQLNARRVISAPKKPAHHLIALMVNIPKPTW